jgi:hypothetical protein
VHTLRSLAPCRCCRTQKMRTRNTMMDTMLSTMTAAAAMKRKSVNCSTTKAAAYMLCLSLHVTCNRSSEPQDTFAQYSAGCRWIVTPNPQYIVTLSHMANVNTLYDVMTSPADLCSRPFLSTHIFLAHTYLAIMAQESSQRMIWQYLLPLLED